MSFNFDITTDSSFIPLHRLDVNTSGKVLYTVPIVDKTKFYRIPKILFSSTHFEALLDIIRINPNIIGLNICWCPIKSLHWDAYDKLLKDIDSILFWDSSCVSSFNVKKWINHNRALYRKKLYILAKHLSISRGIYEALEHEISLYIYTLWDTGKS